MRTLNAKGRVRCQSSQSTMVRSYIAPVQLIANAVQVCCKMFPISGKSPCWYSQIFMGSAANSQSGFSFAMPPKK